MQLKAETRQETGKKVKRLRKEKKLPAVLYGAGKENFLISLDYSDFLKAFRELGSSTILTLLIDDKDTENVLIHDIEEDPVSGDIIHADFLRVKMDEEVHAHIELEFIGESEAVKQGGVLVKNMYEIEVAALPQYLPNKIEVDLSKLKNIDDVITVADLSLPEEVEVLKLHPDEVIATVIEEKPEEEIPAQELDLSQVKVEGEEKRKEKEEQESQK